jgi:ABC-type Fe3+-hydroxamate transport system substrate-binding protein
MEYTDQTGYTFHLKTPPKRIISIVPSQSELLWDLGLQKQLVGITKFCIHPNEMYKRIQRVGGTKKLDIEKIRELKPDLIIGNKEENEQSQIEELRKEFPVWMSDIYDLSDAYEMISVLSEMTNKKQEGDKLIKAIQKKFREGMKNAFSYLSRYPELNAAQIKSADPDLIFLSSEPFPFKEKHVKELQQICPDAQIQLVDGEMFSWYGSRLQYATDYFKSMII